MATAKTIVKSSDLYTKEQLNSLKKLGVDTSKQEVIIDIMIKTLKENDIDMSESDPLSEILDLFQAIKEVEEVPRTKEVKDAKKTKKVVKEEEDEVEEDILDEKILDDLALEVKDKKKEVVKKQPKVKEKEVKVEEKISEKGKKRSAFTLFDQHNADHVIKLLEPFKKEFEKFDLSYKIIHDGFSVKHNSFNSSGRTLYAIKRAKINNETGEFLVTIAITGLRLHKDREEIVKALLDDDLMQKYGVEYGNMPSIYGISVPECLEILKGCMEKMTTTFEKLETRLNTNRIKMEEQVKGVKVKEKAKK